MIKRYRLRPLIVATFVSAFLISGCSSNLNFNTIMKTGQEKSAQQISEAISRMNQSEGSLPISKNMYRRQLSINFSQQELQANAQHEQIIDLFFKSLPESQQLNIIISVAPSSASEPFKTLNDSWTRLRSLKKILEQYSKEIELVYQPDLDVDSATIHAVGNGIKGDHGVQ